MSVGRGAAMSASSSGVGPVRFVDTETHLPSVEDSDGAEDAVEAPREAGGPSTADPSPVDALTVRGLTARAEWRCVLTRACLSERRDGSIVVGNDLPNRITPKLTRIPSRLWSPWDRGFPEVINLKVPDSGEELGRVTLVTVRCVSLTSSWLDLVMLFRA